MKERSNVRTGVRGAGRPRSEQANEAILTAGLELFAAVGFDRMTMEGVAERAGVSKATLYLRWSSKEELVVAVVERFVSEITIPDAGTIEGDLMHLMHDAVRVYRGRAGAVMPGLLSAVAYNPRLADALRQGFLKPRRDALRNVLERGVRRGELREDLDYELALDFLGGPLFYRLLVTGGSLDDELAGGVVSVMLHGLSARGAPRRRVRANASALQQGGPYEDPRPADRHRASEGAPAGRQRERAGTFLQHATGFRIDGAAPDLRLGD